MKYRWIGKTLLGGTIIVLNGLFTNQVVAQSYPDCPPPSSDEYLLLVRGSNEATRERTLSVLPADHPTIVCNYLDDTVVRAGGFTSLEVANSWALYLNDIEQLETVVVESAPATATVPAIDEPIDEPVIAPSPPTPVATEPVIPSPAAEEPTPVTPAPVAPTVETEPPETLAAATQATEYAPTLLGDGVAILVDYQQDPRIGRQLAQEGNVGLAVYLQQPYLLILHTEDASLAAKRLQQLVDSGLTSFLVDGQQVIRLTETIQ